MNKGFAVRTDIRLDGTWVLEDKEGQGLRSMAGGVPEFKLEFAE